MGHTDQPLDGKHCRTRQVRPDMFECLAASSLSWSCRHSFIFGSRYYCMHPDRLSFADPAKGTPC